MKKINLNVRRAVKDAFSSMRRSPGYSIATTFVIVIAFALTNIFTFSIVVLKNAIGYYEDRAEIIIYFKEKTPEEEITKVISELEQNTSIKSVKYVSQEEALKEYTQRFSDHPELVQTVTADMLPPNLEIQANSVEDVEYLVETMTNLQTQNAYIDDVWYFKNFVEFLKNISRAVDILAIVVISTGLIIMITLTNISINFNIVSHKDEIDVQALMGAHTTQIKAPFVISGVFYGFIGSLLASILFVVPLMIINNTIQTSEFAPLWQTTIQQLNLSWITTPTSKTLVLFFIGEILLGSIISGVASLHTVHKTLAKYE